MKSGSHAIKSADHLFQPIRHIFLNHSKLLDAFSFGERPPRNQLAMKLGKAVVKFCGGEQGLIRVAFMGGTRSGHGKISQISESFDEGSLCNVLTGLRNLRPLNRDN
jgi:hypothetical protein